MSYVLGISLGTSAFVASTAVVTTLKATVFEVLKLGVTLLLPIDLRCERASGEADAGAADAESEQTFVLADAFAAATKRAVLLGFHQNVEYYLRIDAATGRVSMAAGPPT